MTDSSKAFRDFVDRWRLLVVAYGLFAHGLTSILNEHSRVTGRAIESTSDPMKLPVKSKLIPESITLYRRDMPSLVHLALDLVISRTIDLFDSYLAEVLLAVTVKRPGLLGDAMVSRTRILEASSIEQLRYELIVDYVDSKSRQGFEEILRLLADKMGVDVQLPDKQRLELRAAFATRNALVHNAGRVDEQFRVQAVRPDLRLGELIRLDEQMIMEYSNAIAGAVSLLEESLRDRGLLSPE